MPAVLRPVLSPNGAYSVTPSVNLSKADPKKYLCVAFKVSDAATGKALHRVSSKASDRMKWAIGWNGNDTIVLYSSDIGTSAWKLSDDGSITAMEQPLPAELISRGDQLRAVKYDD